MRVADFMTPEPWVVVPNDPLSTVAQLMRDHDVGMIPVVADLTSMQPVGVITDRDITIRYTAAGHQHGSARDVMTGGDLVCVRPYDAVDVMMRAMKYGVVRRALVTDDDGRLVGVVATADLLRAAYAVGHDWIESVLEAIAQPTAFQR
jgi:predicted transcriptional regulator